MHPFESCTRLLRELDDNLLTTCNDAALPTTRCNWSLILSSVSLIPSVLLRYWALDTFSLLPPSSPQLRPLTFTSSATITASVRWWWT